LPASDVLAQAEADRSGIDTDLGVWRWAVFLALVLFALFALVPRLLERRLEPARARLEEELTPAYDLTLRLGTVLVREAGLGSLVGRDRVSAQEVARLRGEEDALVAKLRARSLPPAEREAMERLEEALPSWHGALSAGLLLPEDRSRVQQPASEQRVMRAQETLREGLASELAAGRVEVARTEALARSVLTALSAAALIAALLVAFSAGRLARIVRDTRGVVARVVRLQVVTEALSRVLTPDEAARAIVYQGLAALNAASAYLALVGPDGKALFLEVGVGPAEAGEHSGPLAPLSDRGLAAEALRSRKPIWLGSCRERRQHYPDLHLERWEASCEAWVALPLLGPDHPLGVLALGFTTPRDFSATTRGLPLTLARLSGEALQRSRLYAEAHEASRLKSGLILTMSQEIRTPLNSVIGYVELLGMGLSGPVSQGYQKPLQSIRASARQILQVVEDVLAYLQVDTVGEAQPLQWVELPGLMEEVIATVEPHAAREGVRLQLRVYAPPEAGRVEVEAGKVRRILTELVESAVAFSPAGKVELVARVLPGEAVFEVRDTGPAIDARELDRLFEPPAPPDERPPARTGLAMTRRLTRLLGGSISLASRPGEGNAFTVRIPARTDSIPSPALQITASLAPVAVAATRNENR
jgi:signal transduction histidine kinase